MTCEKSRSGPEPFRPDTGSDRGVAVTFLVFALVMGAALFAAQGCSSAVDVLALPSLVTPMPTPRQVAYQRTELLGFLHFGLDTYDGSEQGAPSDTPTLFAPDQLDATQWVKAFKDAGFGQVTLVAKHSTGFCLWPSRFTSYTVAASPWKNHQGDVVRDFTDAMHVAGLKVGLYLSPWDQNYPSTASDYETYFKNQLTELLSDYGPVDEILFDGFRAPTTLDWQGIIALAHTLQPGVLVWTGTEIATTGAELQYLGNETGQATRSTSSVGTIPNGGPSNVWYPSEAPVPDRASSTGFGDWFWHPGDTVISLAQLQTIYFNSVGMNSTLKLNVPPNQSGLLDAPDLNLLAQFGVWYASLYGKDLLAGQPVKADTTWPGFSPSEAVDDHIGTYWAAAEGTTSAVLEVTPASAITFKLISIREPIEIGERTTAYHVELLQNGTWNSAPTDASGAIIKGSVIGQRQLWQVKTTTADALRLVIDSAKAAPAIAELSLY